VLCHPPEFSGESGEANFHSDSPAGRLLKGRSAPFRFLDPHRSMGGFGASGAEYCLTSFSLHPNLSPWDRWEEYRKIGSGSGVDVLAQCLSVGQPGPWWIWPQSRSAEKLLFCSSQKNSMELRIFHTGKKLKTHEQNLNANSSETLAPLVFGARDAFRVGSFAALAQSINSYHEALMELGLMAEHSNRIVAEARKQQGVWAAKGCGAMGADVILLLCENNLDLSGLEKHFSLLAVHREPL
jgi:hypothetical protein